MNYGTNTLLPRLQQATPLVAVNKISDGGADKFAIYEMDFVPHDLNIFPCAAFHFLLNLFTIKITG